MLSQLFSQPLILSQEGRKPGILFRGTYTVRPSPGASSRSIPVSFSHVARAIATTTSLGSNGSSTSISTPLFLRFLVGETPLG